MSEWIKVNSSNDLPNTKQELLVFSKDREMYLIEYDLISSRVFVKTPDYIDESYHQMTISKDDITHYQIPKPPED